MVFCDQKTKQNTGILCDLCGSIRKDKFLYYSVKLDLVEVDKAIGKTGIVNLDRRFMDLDLCQGCANKIIDQVKEVIKKRESGGSWSSTV
jgi:hypothetical protein